jgi:hypothetical protein
VVIAGCWGEVVELVDLLGGQLDAVGGDVLLDPGDALGAGDGSDVVALGQQPGQGDLRRGGAGLGRDGLDLVGDSQVALEVRAGEARVGLAPVVVHEVLGRADLQGFAVGHGAVASGTWSRLTVRSKTRPGSILPSSTSGSSSSM